MSIELYQVFEKVEIKARFLTNLWKNFCEEISQYLPDTYQPEILELNFHLEKALDKLVYELNHPVLTLATTGTTSSGKSTLVNLLCGAEIVPMAVSEMSAGSVTIEYSDTKSLEIKKTHGATWDCGEWYDISDSQIYHYLEKAMQGYLDHKETDPNIACPQAIIRYPIRFLRENSLKLPKETKFQILDLPGLAHVGDEGNASVIRQCREALCIVTYNSAETDKQKVSNLLQEVVSQVKDLGGSPSRMLFVLNRIDVFQEDKNPHESEARFTEETIKSIKDKLKEHLQEYTKEIEQLNVVKLSSRPALLSILIQSQEGEQQIAACRKADQFCSCLIGNDVLDDLPRNPAKWSHRDRERVAEKLWQNSYAIGFERSLVEHINQHFPELVIPQIIDRFNVTAGNKIVEWVTQTTSAILNSSAEKYQRECENIERIANQLRQFLEYADHKLRDPFEKARSNLTEYQEKKTNSDPILQLENTVQQLQNAEPYSSLGEKLQPIYGWRRELAFAVEQILGAVAKSIQDGSIDLSSTYLKKVESKRLGLLESDIRKLIDLKYTGSNAKNGMSVVAKSDIEKRDLKELNERLNLISKHLSVVMEDALSDVLAQELNRVYEAVYQLFKLQLKYLEDGSANIAPNMAVKLPESQLIRVNHSLKFNIAFQAGFAITQGIWNAEVKEEVKRRPWYFLWLIEVTDYKVRYEKRTSDNAQVPPIEELLSGWLLQAKAVTEGEIIDQILDWFLEQMKIFNDNVSQFISNIKDRYRERLDKAHQELTLDYQRQKHIWEPIHSKGQELSKQFSELRYSQIDYT